ncbi:MAG: hypothetical protein ACM3NH_01770 [Candidatus Saccharibacteria bacterium]
MALKIREKLVNRKNFARHSRKHKTAPEREADRIRDNVGWVE